MSTTIYEAFKFVHPTKKKPTLEDVQIFLNKVREKVRDVYKPVSRIKEIREEWRTDYQLFHKKYAGPYSMDGVEENCVVYCDNSTFYIQFFLGWRLKELSRSFYKSKYLEDFHYQNQTDEPEDVTAKEWENRRVTWDRMLKKGRDCPMMSGFSYYFMTITEFNLLLMTPDNEL